MRPRLGRHLTLELSLNAIVTDGRGGVERVRDLGLRQRLEEARFRGMARPDAREAIRLELGADGLAGGTLFATRGPAWHWLSSHLTWGGRKTTSGRQRNAASGPPSTPSKGPPDSVLRPLRPIVLPVPMENRTDWEETDMRRLRLLLVLISLVALAAAAAPVSADRGSWNNWHVHDGAAVPFTDASGLRHEDLSIWPLIWPDYPSDESPVVYCTDGAEKALVGGDGGSKLAAGTCRNDLYIIPIQLNASDAPAPAGWMALPLGGVTLYYRLTPR